jgi:hypothetical protein
VRNTGQPVGRRPNPVEIQLDIGLHDSHFDRYVAVRPG